MSTKTTKPAVASKTAKTEVKKSTAKTAAKPAAKKAVKAPKEKAERKAKVVSEVVSPVMNSVMGLINDANTSEADLKSLRLELRKAVKASRATLRNRKSAPAVATVNA